MSETDSSRRRRRELKRVRAKKRDRRGRRRGEESIWLKNLPEFGLALCFLVGILMLSLPLMGTYLGQSGLILMQRSYGSVLYLTSATHSLQLPWLEGQFGCDIESITMLAGGWGDVLNVMEMNCAAHLVSSGTG